VTGTTPDIVADDPPGQAKYGVALNVEQPLAAVGETGLFLRLGWNDGHTETFA
jgi:high affinity Mn2+ porin